MFSGPFSFESKTNKVILATHAVFKDGKVPAAVVGVVLDYNNFISAKISEVNTLKSWEVILTSFNSL